MRETYPETAVRDHFRQSGRDREGSGGIVLAGLMTWWRRSSEGDVEVAFD